MKPANIKWIGSPNFGYPRGTKGRKGHKVLAIVNHTMEGTLRGTDSHFSSSVNKVSAHFGVGKRGQIHQYVDIHDAAWANGGVREPSWALLPARVNPNLVTVSIEHEGRSGEPLTSEQYKATVELQRWLVKEFSLKVSQDTIIGHHMLNSITRPNCPGPAFPWAQLFKDLEGEDKMGTFKDVDPKKWYANDVEAANKYGLMVGTAPGIFDPGKPLTRAEMAAVSVRLYRLIGVRFARIIDRILPAILQVNNFQRGGLGSGAIIHPKGYVLTNKHVTQGATTVAFQTPDGSLPWGAYAEGPVLYEGKNVDLAMCLVQVPGIIYPTLPVKKDKLKKASDVIAVGSPLGLIRSVSEGIVSGFRRFGQVSYIQTNAQINPGNSGGALVNLEGKLIGVPTMKLVGEGIEGLGFAIDIETVKAFVLEGIAAGKLPVELAEIF